MANEKKGLKNCVEPKKTHRIGAEKVACLIRVLAALAADLVWFLIFIW